MRLPCLSLLIIGLCAGCGKTNHPPASGNLATNGVALPTAAPLREPIYKVSEAIQLVLPEDVDVYSRPKVMLSPDGQHYACLLGRSRVLSAAELAEVQSIVSGKRLSTEYLKSYEAGGMSAFVVVDGQKHFPVNYAWGDFSPDSRRFGYHAKTGTQYARDRNGQTRQVATDFIVVDGQPASGNYFTFNQPPQFSPDGEVWVAVGEKPDASLDPEKKNVMIVNGQEIGWVMDGWGNDSYLLFSPVGHDYLFVTLTNRVQQAGQTHHSQMVCFNGRQKWVYNRVDRPRFTPDGRHWGFLAMKERSGEGPVLVMDGQETLLNLADDENLASSPPFPNLLLGRDAKHTFYLTSRKPGQPMWAWWKGQRGNSYTYIRHPSLSPDGTRMAYTAENNRVRQLVVDGEEKNWGQPISGGVFSPNSKRIATIIETGSGDKQAEAVVVDGLQQMAYASIQHDSLRWSPDSQRVAYLAKEKNQWRLVADNAEQPLPPQIEAFESHRLIFSADSTRVALVGKYYTNAFWAEIGYVSPMYKDVLDFAFSPDGQHQACVVTEGRPHALDHEIRWTVIVNQTHKQTYDRVWDSGQSSVQAGRWIWIPTDQYESSGLVPRLLWWTNSQQLRYWVMKGRDISMVTQVIE